LIVLYVSIKKYSATTIDIVTVTYPAVIEVALPVCSGGGGSGSGGGGGGGDGGVVVSGSGGGGVVAGGVVDDGNARLVKFATSPKQFVTFCGGASLEHITSTLSIPGISMLRTVLSIDVPVPAGNSTKCSYL